MVAQEKAVKRFVLRWFSFGKGNVAHVLFLPQRLCIVGNLELTRILLMMQAGVLNPLAHFRSHDT
jgi:hypothetical protein